jgi:hypothetical protein
MSVECNPKFIDAFTLELCKALDVKAFNFKANEVTNIASAQELMETLFMAIMDKNFTHARNSATMTHLSKPELVAVSMAKTVHWLLRWSWSGEGYNDLDWQVSNFLDDEPEIAALLRNVEPVWRYKLAVLGPEFYIKASSEKVPAQELLAGSSFWSDNPSVMIMDAELYYLGKLKPKKCPQCQATLPLVPHPIHGYTEPERMFLGANASGTAFGSTGGLGAISIGLSIRCSSRRGCGEGKSFRGTSKL